MIIASKETTDEDPSIPTRPGWAGMHTWWVLSKETSGTTGVVTCISEFAPGVAHTLHRHANARETLYMAWGSGLMFSDTQIRRVCAGDTITVELNEWHAFMNDRKETVRIIGFYAHDTYADIDYEEMPSSLETYQALRAAHPDV